MNDLFRIKWNKDSISNGRKRYRSACVRKLKTVMKFSFNPMFQINNKNSIISLMSRREFYYFIIITVIGFIFIPVQFNYRFLFIIILYLVFFVRRKEINIILRYTYSALKIVALDYNHSMMYANFNYILMIISTRNCLYSQNIQENIF